MNLLLRIENYSERISLEKVCMENGSDIRGFLRPVKQFLEKSKLFELRVFPLDGNLLGSVNSLWAVQYL
tara:strand:+ start:321 stop:527 length:207 start_codon:yes stop_codon:yes gene_type:complete